MVSDAKFFTMDFFLGRICIDDFGTDDVGFYNIFGSDNSCYNLASLGRYRGY